MTPPADRFDPRRSLPEIDPHAGRARGAGQGPDAGAGPGQRPGGRTAAARGAGPGAGTGSPIDPWSRRGLGSQLVQTTSGTAPEPPSEALRGATPEPPAGEPGRRRGDRGPYADPPKKKLKGRKAVEAYEREQEERRRAEAEAARIAADRESRGVAGFADKRTRAQGVSISNPDYAPRAGYVADDAAPPTPPKPWYRKWAIMVPLAVLLVAALAVGLGWPAYQQLRATAEADEAAGAYQRAMTAYELAWTPDQLDALVAPQLSGALDEVDDPLAQPVEAQHRLDDECAKLDGASRAMASLTASPPPTLAEVGGAQFSTAYQDAAALDSGFGAERQRGQALIDAMRATMPELTRFCQNFRLGLQITNTASAEDATDLQALRTVAPGQVVDLGVRQMTCEDPLGCVNYADKEARERYADVWTQIAETRDEGLIAHYDAQCWLSALTPYCVLMSDAVEVRREGLGDIAQGITQNPSNDPATGPFPDLDAAIAASAAAYGEAERLAYLEAGRVDPAVLSDLEPAWEVRMISRMLGSFERHLGEAVEGARGDARG